MARRYYALFLALFSVPLVAGLAFAECAWVLWSKQTAVSSPSAVIPDWGIHSSHKAVGDCIKTLDEIAGVEPGKRTRQTPTVVILGGGSVAMCLPDTVDPRGPKGK